MKFPLTAINSYFEEANFQKGLFSIWGDFGTGKTTFALQTAKNSTKNKKLVYFIYTKPNLPCEKIQIIFRDSTEDLKLIKFIIPNNYEDLNNMIFNLEFFILRNSKKNEEQLKLIIIDSLTDLYRLELNKEIKEKNYTINYMLNQILANLLYLNNTYHIEVLIVNEKTQKKDKDNIIEVQSGGKVMEYWIFYNIKIERTNKLNERIFILSNRFDNKKSSFKAMLNEEGF